MLLASIWSIYYIANKVSVNSLSPFFVGIIVRLITFILLTLIMIKKGKIKKIFRTNGVFWRLILIGFLGFALDITAFFGLKYSTAANGAILLKSDIIFANLISILFLKERFSKFDWIFTSFAVAGVFLVINVDFSAFRFNGLGDLFFILSAFFIALNAFVIRSVQLDKKNPVTDNVVAFYNNFITLLLFTAFFFLFNEKISTEVFSSNPILIFSLLAGGITQTLIYILYYYNLRRLKVWIVKIFLLFIPVFTVFFSVLFLDERIKPVQLLGMLVLIIGAWGIISEQKRKLFNRR